MRPVATSNPLGRFASTGVDWDSGPPPQGLELIDDQSRTILSRNDSPDVPFTYSVNAYRGCTHGCSYCYARATHEYLGLGAGTDFDRKIVVKRRAPELLREAFDARSWRGEPVVMSGVTDPYPPIEATLGLTRACLEVCLAYKNPVGIITKSPLIERDLELLGALSRVADVHVSVSVGTWDEAHARAVEPFVATPRRRIRTLERLAAAGLAPRIMVAPIIPGLSEPDVPTILRAAKDAGAVSAGRTVLRLGGSVREVFVERTRAALPLRVERVLSRTRDLHGGRLDDARFGARQRGEGAHADALGALFDATAARLGLSTAPRGEHRRTFERPAGRQLPLF